MTSNPDHIPLVDIRQGYFHKSFELLIKFGLWPVVNSECWLWSTGWGLPTVLMSAATGCKLAKLDWNKIEHQNTFFQYFSHFYPISGIHWTLKMPYVFKHLEVYMKTWFLYYFINKWLHTILYHFKSLCDLSVDLHGSGSTREAGWGQSSRRINVVVLWGMNMQMDFVI